MLRRAMAPGSGVFEVKTRDRGKAGSAGFLSAIMANSMLPIWSDHDTKTGRLAENALVNRVYY